MRGVIIIASALALVGVPTSALAGAKIRFYAYEGVDAVQTGTGGTRLAKNGIDYWTSGAPPRRYQILGMFTDQRYEDWGDGSAIGSRSLAKKVLALGGSALIVIGADQRSMGSMGSGFGSTAGNVASGSFWSFGLDRTATRLLAVKYLDQ